MKKLRGTLRLRLFCGTVTCDACGLPATKEKPVVELREGSGFARSTIWFHEHCFNAMLNKKKKKEGGK